jgi:3',5'-cyclic AMP phosphodiesterase CpdA
MPFHLPPISRRAFLRRAALFSSTLAVSPSLLASAHRTDSDSFAMLADTHIAADPAQVTREVNMFGNLNGVAGEILGLRRNPAGIFIVGDCALGDGQPGDYRTLLKGLEPLRAAGMTAHLALGNHDDRGNFRAIVKPVTDHDNVGHHVSVVRSRRANWFMLDSLEKTLQTPGLLGPEQLEWLARALDADSSKPAIIVAHHNPNSQGVIVGLKDTDEFFKVVRPRRHVKAFFFGHTHDCKVTQDESGIHLINLPPTAYVFKPTNPSGWVHAELGRSGIKLELRCIQPAHERHKERHKLKWRK